MDRWMVGSGRLRRGPGNLGERFEAQVKEFCVHYDR